MAISATAVRRAAVALLARRRPQVLVLLCVSRHVLHFAINLLFSLQRLHRLPQTALLCLDEATREAFSRLQMGCALLPVDPSESAGHELGVPQRPGPSKAEWQRAKLLVLSQLLGAGQHVLLCDVDTVWQHDIVPVLLQPLLGSRPDVVVARALRPHNGSELSGRAPSAGPLNSGLVFLRATAAARAFAEAARERLGGTDAAEADQKALNGAVAALGLRWLAPDPRAAAADEDVLLGSAATPAPAPPGAPPPLRLELLPLQLVSINVVDAAAPDAARDAARGGGGAAEARGAARGFRWRRAYVVHAKQPQLRRLGLWQLRADWRAALAALAPAAPAAPAATGNRTASRLARLADAHWRPPRAEPEPRAACGGAAGRAPAPIALPYAVCLGGCLGGGDGGGGGGGGGGDAAADAGAPARCALCSCAACASCRPTDPTGRQLGGSGLTDGLPAPD